MAIERKKQSMDGNTAAAHVSYAFTEVAAIYPITPSSVMAELTDAWSANDLKNIMGENVKVSHLSQILVVPNLDLLDLVGGTETVKEVKERNAALDSCKVCNCTEVHNLLRVSVCEHCETGLTASVNVGVISEDVKRVRCYATS